MIKRYTYNVYDMTLVKIQPIAILSAVTLSIALLLMFTFLTFIMKGNYCQRTDYLSFLVGAKIIKSEQKSELYNLTRQLNSQNTLINKAAPNNSEKTFLPYRYPPLYAVMFTPFLKTTCWDSYKIFTAINLTVLIGVSIITWKKLKKNKYRLIFSVLPFIYPWTYWTLAKGQNSLIFLVVLAASYYLTEKKHSAFAGSTSSLFLLKPQLIPLIPFILILNKNKKMFLLGFTSIALLLIAININLIGTESAKNYPAFLFQTENALHGSPTKYFSGISPAITTIVTQTNEHSRVPYFVSLFLFVFFVKIFYRAKNKVKRKYLYTYAVIIALLFGFHVGPYDFVLLLLPIYLLAKDVANPKKAYSLILICSTIQIAGIYITQYSITSLLYIPVAIYAIKKP